MLKDWEQQLRVMPKTKNREKMYFIMVSVKNLISICWKGESNFGKNKTSKWMFGGKAVFY